MQLHKALSKEGDQGCWGFERAPDSSQEAELSPSAGPHKGNHFERLKKAILSCSTDQFISCDMNRAANNCFIYSSLTTAGHWRREDY